MSNMNTGWEKSIPTAFETECEEWDDFVQKLDFTFAALS